MSAANKLREALDDSYRSALSGSFVPFPYGVDAASPLNSVPFRVDLEALRKDWSWSPSRKDLLRHFGSYIDEIRISLDPICGLIGGSFVDRTCNTPKDIDVVIFYESSALEAPPIAKLQDLGRKSFGIDCRLIPLDVDPIVSLRAASFFSVLYTVGIKPARQERVGNPPPLAPLFIDLPR